METKSLLDRLADKVLLDDGCWAWTGSRNKSGYGTLNTGRSTQYAHRVVYEILNGDIGAETLDHLCRNRSCVNPSHLEPVSRSVNILRGQAPPAVNARKTTCKRGHRLDADVYVSKDGRRDCRVCRRQRRRRGETVGR